MLEDISALENCTVSSVPDGYDAFLLAQLWEKSARDILYIVSDGVALENTAHILSVIRPEAEVLKFPAWDTVPYDRVSPNVNIVAARIGALSALAQNPSPKKPRIIVTSAGAAIQRLPLKKIFLNSMKNVSVGGELNFNDFVHYAVVNGYNRVDPENTPSAVIFLIFFRLAANCRCALICSATKWKRSALLIRSPSAPRAN